MGFEDRPPYAVVVVGIAVIGVTLLYNYLRKALTIPKLATYEIPNKGDPASPIVLVDFKKLPGLASSVSPYCAKVETWLRFNNLPYTKRLGDLSEAPLGKLPFIVHGDTKVPDSTFIIKYLTNTYPDKVLKLTSEQQGLSVLLSGYLDYKFIGNVWVARWVYDEGWKGIYKNFLMDLPLPPLLRPVIAAVIRRDVYNSSKSLGIMAFCPADQHKVYETELAALSAVLGKQDYLTGSTPSEADAALFGFLDTILNDGFMPVLPDMARKHPNLVAFVERIRARFYPELGEA